MNYCSEGLYKSDRNYAIEVGYDKHIIQKLLY